MKQSLFILLMVVTAGCAGLSTEKVPNPEPTGVESVIGLDLTEGAPALSPTETAVLVPQTEFDPNGLSIGPGSGFTVLDDPEVIPAAQATWLAPQELVLGVAVGDEARAYPISQMAYHHIANDQIDGEPYLVTY